MYSFPKRNMNLPDGHKYVSGHVGVDELHLHLRASAGGVEMQEDGG